ncbi:hypothetical protein EIP86_000098 [Pleurotus ostreatoroseus]|nr:hypothetical protein EIP86_000098 [Pleurotus ostreatoroseus]
MASLSPPQLPPLDGSIPVLPGFLDFHAANNPDHPWALFPSVLGKGTQAISFSELAAATHRIAHAVRPDREGVNGEVIALIIHCDTVLYVATLIGIVRAGFVPFPMSPRNSPAAIVNMMEQTSCKRIISQSSLSTLIDSVKVELDHKHFSARVDELPGLNEIFPTLDRDATSAPLTLYPGSSEPRSAQDVVLYLHSSGSTGFPKAIPQTQITIRDWCKAPILTSLQENGAFTGVMALPSFHTFGIYSQIYGPLRGGYPVAMFAPQAPASPVVPNPRNVLEVAKALGCSSLVIVPAFIEIWAQSLEDVAYLASLQSLHFGGGPLSAKTTEQLLAAGVKLNSIYGTTEFGAPTNIVELAADRNSDPQADTMWFSFYDDLKYRMVPEGDGSYELHILTSDTHHPSVENLPDTEGYATQDLFEPHPVKRGYWKITGRKDDVLILGSGEKIVPIPQEGHIMSDGMVAGAVMFGRGKNQSGILIEPHPDYAVDPKDEIAVAGFRNKVWPVVEEANDSAPGFARIFKEMIIVTDPARPLPRAAKSTVLRKLALAEYQKEIEGLYDIVENSGDVKNIVPPSSWEVPQILDWLLRLASDIKEDSSILPTLDLFDQGFDSLHATFLRNKIVATLRNADKTEVRQGASKVTQNFVFEHPTLRDLAETVKKITDADDEVEKDVPKEIEAMLERYASDLPIYTPRSKTSEDVVVFLTGSTGSIGSQILATLLNDSRITTVYTFNRPSSGSVVDRQRVAFEERGLPTSLLSHSKLVQLSGDLAADRFGLPESVLDKVVNTVTHVVHNAWKVDFNQGLKSFEPIIANTRKLVEACYTFAQPVKFFYTSSISVGFLWDPSHGQVPEEPLDDPTVASASGYSASKYVIEQLLAKASLSGLSTTTLRIGQVCGSEETGAWSTTEWVAVLVKSSISLGAFPDLKGNVSWIPMDAVAFAVSDLILTPQTLPLLVNVVHPRTTAWHEILENMNKHIAEPLPFADFNSWVQQLEAYSESATAEDLERMPAIKLLDFFRALAYGGQSRAPSDIVEAGGAAGFRTDKLLAFSKTVRDLAPLSEKHASSWLKFWKSKQFL